MDEEIYQSAVHDLLQITRDNSWFRQNYWPLFEPHVRQMAADLTAHVAPDESHHVLDVGCFNGYVSYLFRRLGYRVTGADVQDFGERRELFDSNGIGFVRTNFNDLDAFPDVADETFDAVILAQVIEHILNHPLGFVTELARVTRPGGLLVVTTPQAASVMNASRLLLGSGSTWGTDDFIRLPKIAGGEIIPHAGIHYREYLSHELCSLVEEAGFELLKTRFLGVGAAGDQPAWKRHLKSNSIVRWLMTQRLFASNQYVLARKRVV